MALAKTAKSEAGRIFLLELLARLRYAAVIDAEDREACGLQNLARQIIADLAEMDCEAAKNLHAQACGWAQNP